MSVEEEDALVFVVGVVSSSIVVTLFRLLIGVVGELVKVVVGFGLLVVEVVVAGLLVVEFVVAGLLMEVVGVEVALIVVDTGT